VLSLFTGNEANKEIEENPRITVKQERVEEMCNSAAYSDTIPATSRKNRTPRQETSMYEFRKELSPEKIKDKHLTRVSGPESPSHTDSPTRPGSNNQRESESLLFPWTPKERLRNLRLEAVEKPSRGLYPGVSYLRYPVKRVYNRFQSAPTMASTFPENISERQRRFATEMNLHLAQGERKQTIQYEANRDGSSVDGNLSNGENSTIQEERGSRPRIQSSSPPNRTEQTVSSQESGCTQPIVDSSHLNKKDEEPVWKTYQWYRDRKRPYSQQVKRQKAEPTIFMQYNEIRDKRFKEGRVVSDKRRSSEPWTFPYTNESDPLSPSSHDTGTSFQSSHVITSHNDAHEQPESPNKRRKLLDNSNALPEDNRPSKGNVRADENFMQQKHTGRHYSSSGNDLHQVSADENSNFEINKTAQHGMSSRGVESRYHFKAVTNGDKFSRAHNDEEISSTVYQDGVDVSPGALRHCPQDVAKILRLNRIVKAVRNNRENKTAEKTRRLETSSSQNGFQNRGKDRVHSVERQETQVKSSSDSDEDFDRRRYGHETTTKTEEKRNKNENFTGIFCPEGNRQQPIKYGRKNNVEESPEFSDFTQSYSDPESFFAGQMEAEHDSDPVCQVNGLLSLPGFKETKFNISLGELKRRMNPPETLTRVEMISYVRQAKSSGRVLLDRNNIVTANRSHPTILSRVCESEAQVLADGILKMNREYLPLSTLARKTVNAYKDDGCKVDNCEDCRLKLRRRIVDVEITRLVCHAL